MAPALPFWFKQRQAKAEDSGPNGVRVTAPNQQEVFLRVYEAPTGGWAAALRHAADGPDEVATDPYYATAMDAWLAAFELYRTDVVV